MDVQEQKPSLISKLKSFIIESRRVFRITKKPSMMEFKSIVKISSIGIAVIGIIGFLIHLLWSLIK